MRPISWQRFIAWNVLLCWIYFSTAVSLVHTCRSVILHDDVPSLNCTTACISCQWVTTGKSGQITPPPSIPLPLTVESSLPTPSLHISTSAPIFISVRAPPA